MFETELRRLGLHEHWYKDRNEFEQKVADLVGKVDFWKLVLEGLDILLKTYGTPERIYIKTAKDDEGAFHARICESAEGQCGGVMLKRAGRPVKIAGLKRSVLG